jgi:flavin-dependent dehydrogenase
VHWADDGEAYVTPVAPDCVGVALLGGRGGSFAERLLSFPSLAARLDGIEPGPVLAAGPMRQDVARRVHGRVLLVGDAAGYVDALTGEGLALAFGCARALVTRLTADDPAGYERDYRVLSRRYRLITSALLAAAGRPTLRRQIVPAAARLPWLFGAAVDQLAR